MVIERPRRRDAPCFTGGPEVKAKINDEASCNLKELRWGGGSTGDTASRLQESVCFHILLSSPTAIQKN